MTLMQTDRPLYKHSLALSRLTFHDGQERLRDETNECRHVCLGGLNVNHFTSSWEVWGNLGNGILPMGSTPTLQ